MEISAHLYRERLAGILSSMLHFRPSSLLHMRPLKFWLNLKLKNAHCPLFFALSHSPLKGDKQTSHWPAARLYAFPPINILPLVLCTIREEGASVILTAPNWPNQLWSPDLTELLVAPPCLIPVRNDLLF